MKKLKRKLKHFIKTYSHELIYLFFTGSVCGWSCESVINQLSGTGSVISGSSGLLCGIGTILLYMMLHKAVRTPQNLCVKLLISFFGTSGIVTAAELAVSYIMEFFTGHWQWESYSGYLLNFQGRIALIPSLLFGVTGCLICCVAFPFFQHLVRKIGRKKSRYLTILALLLLAAVWGYITFLK